MVMLSGDGTYVLSPSDLTAASSCEFAWLRAVDSRLGRLTERLPDAADPMLDRTAQLGGIHEQRHLERLIAQHGSGVVQLNRPNPYNPATLLAAHETTIGLLRAEAPVIYQAAFFDGSFGGLADFLVRNDDGAYEVWDTKLARQASVSALLQISAYAHQLDLEGIPRSQFGYLQLGNSPQADGTNRPFEQVLTEIIPVYLEHRAKLNNLLTARLAASDPVEWNDPRYSYCGSCAICTAEIETSDDLHLVAGMRKSQRAKLRGAGIHTIHDLAAADATVEAMNPDMFDKLRQQAQIQVAPTTLVGAREVPAFELIDADMVRRLPATSDGDVFFDFEGDPLWSDASGSDWGLEYLFGVIEPDDEEPVFRPWWAHDRSSEKAALIGFLDYVVARRAQHPGMHVYHYAPYEVSALKRLVGRHGTHEDVLDDLLRGGVFIDLYQTVRQALRVGTRSYSIKKLEPLYMGSELREGLDNAADSIVEYQRYTELVGIDDEAAAKTLAGIADYNRYDCLSTWRLRDWLLAQLLDEGPQTTAPGDDLALATGAVDEPIDELAPLMEALRVHAGESEERTADEQAAAMLAAAIGFHRREHKPFWWAFFSRLVDWPSEWIEPRDCMHAVDVQLVEDWNQEGSKLPARTLRLTGELEAASNLKIGTDVKGVYDDVPLGFEAPQEGVRCVGGGASIADLNVNSAGLDVVTVRERKPKAVNEWDELPIGLCIPSPVPTKSIEMTLIELATDVCDQLPQWPRSAGLDILRRIPPRLVGSGGLEVAGGAITETILDTVRKLDRSYLAVQGPPGTGKTYVGSHVIKELVEAGWRVGVVAQSHAVVENFLHGVVRWGLSPELIAKPKGADDVPWANLNGAKLRRFIDDHESTGCLVGGTAWTFSARGTVGFEQLDLLVIDEAGQFSLANTLAAATSAQRLLLLGDPQQLPQVSQGTHPEPVDTSALEWIASDYDTLPPDRGYFLERTWRMHSELTAAVSRLSYGGRLRSQSDATDTRVLSGVTPGVHPITIDHSGNAVQSSEEAAAIVKLVADLQRETWKESDSQSARPLNPSDVLVVAPYNAQCALLRRELDAAGFAATRVGTVDKFQGQEAPVVIVSMTASSADDVPRGMDFLFNRNRLNVAVSRGQWAAYIVRSRSLTDFLPSTPAGLEQLGAFIRLAG